MVRNCLQSKISAAFLLPALLLGCGKDKAVVVAEPAAVPLQFSGTLYSDCFPEVQFRRRGYTYFRDEFDFLPKKELRLTRLWFNDSNCLGAATDVRLREGEVLVKLAEHQGFEAPIITVSYDPPHLEEEVIKFSARVEDRKTAIAFHILQEVTYQSGQTAERNDRKVFLLRKKAPFF